jgi:hypothetical protein
MVANRRLKSLMHAGTFCEVRAKIAGLGEE